MAELRDSSVLFSLKQLMGLEEQRLREEDDARACRAEAERLTRLAMETRAREAEAARLAAAEERRRLEESRRREEAARHEAIRLAELERARGDAGRRAHLEELEHQQRHEQRLAVLQADVQKLRLKRALTVTAVGSALALGAALAGYLGVMRPEAERRDLAEAARLRGQEDENRLLRQSLAQHDGELARIEQEAHQARDLAATQKAQLEAAAAARARADADAKKARPTGGPAVAPPRRDTGCTCAYENDPLCPCLK